jgi:hypothetical protein
MRNKELVSRRLQKAQSHLKHLQQTTNTSDKEMSIRLIDELNSLMEDILSIVDREEN